jgi:hypothetical protein
MSFDYQLLYILIVIGLLTKRLHWRGWFGVCLLIFSWMMFNWLHG